MRHSLVPAILCCFLALRPAQADDLYHIQRDELRQIKARMIDERTFRGLPETPLVREQVRRLDERVDDWLAAESGYWSEWKDIGHPAITLGATAWTVPSELARAYGMPAGRHHRDPRVLAAVEGGLRHLLTFAYPDCKLPGNWWAWQIGMPMQLIPTLMLLEKDLDPELFRRELETVRYLLKADDDAKLTGGFVPPAAPATGKTDMNALWHKRLRLEFGVLVENPAMAGKWAYEAFGELNVPGEGMLQTDFSYKFHGQIPMWAYGRSFILDYGLLAGRYEGTRFGPSPGQIDQYAEMLARFVNGFLYRGRLCPAIIGREISRGPRSPENPSVLAVLAVMAGTAHPRAAEFARLYAREWRYVHLGADPIPRTADPATPRMGHLAGHLAGVPVEAPAPPVDDVFAYPDSDFLQITRPGWAVGLKMHSRRNIGYESINGENLQGWFLSHGSMFHYIDGDEWDGCWPTLDWTRLPGTTVSDRVRGQNTSPFAGVLRASPRAALAAMELKRDGFTACKSWMIDGDVIVCAGSDIAGPGRLETTVLNTPEKQARGDDMSETRRDSDAATELLIDHHSAGPGPFEKTMTVRSVWFQRVGYVFPGGAKVHVIRGPRTSDWSSIRDPARHGGGEKATHRYVTMVIPHGPDNPGYCYFMLPDVERLAWRRRADAALEGYIVGVDGPHTVRSRDGKVESAVLWTAGRAGPLRADRGCMALRIEADWWVTEPAWGAGPLKLSLSGKELTLQPSRGRAVQAKR